MADEAEQVLAHARCVCMPRPGEVIFATPLAGQLLSDFRPGQRASTVTCQIPGGRRLHIRASRSEQACLAAVAGAVAASGALTTS